MKCLNPGLFFGGGKVNDHAAVVELVKEADMLGRCVHSSDWGRMASIGLLLGPGCNASNRARPEHLCGGVEFFLNAYNYFKDGGSIALPSASDDKCRW